MPSWFEKDIVPEKEFILAVGHSAAQPDEQKARDEAVSDAIKNFARYCKADIDSIDRIYETYSSGEHGVKQNLSIENRNQIRVKAFVKHAQPEDWFIQPEGKKWLASVLLKIPQEEADRIASEKSAKLSLDIGLYYEDETGKMKPMGEGTSVKSGGGYAIYANPSDSCYIYVYQTDSMNKVTKLFPNPEFETDLNPVPAGSELWIPNSKRIFFLDETTGRETIYIFASADKISELEGAAAPEMSGNEISDIGKKMGAAGIRSKLSPEYVSPPEKNTTVEISKKLQAEGAFVYKTSFWHR